jgi:hypothetical protein
MKDRMLTDPAHSSTDRPLRVIDCFGNAMAPEVRARRAGRPLAGGG